jgi:peptide/nickel transport system permease protein
VDHEEAAGRERGEAGGEEGADLGDVPIVEDIGKKVDVVVARERVGRVVFADALAPYGMNQIAPLNRLKPPSWAFPFGTDNLGRDMLSRCLYGAQLSVIIGFCAAGIATIISVVLGIISGYLGGKFDIVLQRFVDAWMSFPDLIILIVVVSVVGPGMPQIIVTLGLLLGIAGSRIIRGAVVSVRENMYVHAAQSTGASGEKFLRAVIVGYETSTDRKSVV